MSAVWVVLKIFPVFFWIWAAFCKPLFHSCGYLYHREFRISELGLTRLEFVITNLWPPLPDARCWVSRRKGLCLAVVEKLIWRGSCYERSVRTAINSMEYMTVGLSKWRAGSTWVPLVFLYPALCRLWWVVGSGLVVLYGVWFSWWRTSALDVPCRALVNSPGLSSSRNSARDRW